MTRAAPTSQTCEAARAPASQWALHLLQSDLPERPALPAAEALRVQQLQDRLMAALAARDRAAVRSARQAVLDAALLQPGSPALRRCLRALAWRLAALLPRAV